MPLPGLPPDPQPSADELAPYLLEKASTPVEYRSQFARIAWADDVRKRDDSAFLVPFATEVDGYPAYLYK